MSILNVNKINPVGGGSTITIAGIASVTSSVTAPSFVGAVTGNVTGNADTASGLSGNPSINTTGIITATSFAPTTGQLSHRNIIINGDMRLAQRGTSSTANNYLIDRFRFSHGGTDEAPTQAQVDVASGTTPYTLGFKKALKITNGNQTSGAGAADYIEFYQYIEDQDISNSGWNFKSDTSFITISFWVKSSVAQKFTGFLYTNQAAAGDSYMYSYQIDNGSGGNLTADTWTKVTHSIQGMSSLTFNNDNTNGLAVGFYMFEGTDYSTSGHTDNTWAQWTTSNKIKDMTSTWYTTNDATFEITGVQLEVGPVATPFEHRSYADELRRCQRYYVQFGNGYNTGARGGSGGSLALYNYHLPVPLRAAPTFITNPGSLTGFNVRAYKYNGLSDSTNTPSLATNGYTLNSSFVYVQQSGHSLADDRVASIQQSGTIGLSAEL